MSEIDLWEAFTTTALLMLLIGAWLGFWLASGWQEIRGADRWVAYQKTKHRSIDHGEQRPTPKKAQGEKAGTPDETARMRTPQKVREGA